MVALDLSPDGIIKRFNSLEDAKEFAQPRNSTFRYACQVLRILRKQGETQMFVLRKQICSGYQDLNRVLERLKEDGTLSVRDKGYSRDSRTNITVSGRHYSLTEEGKVAARHIDEKIELLPGYEQEFWPREDEDDLED
jgi:hypothetical protein